MKFSLPLSHFQNLCSLESSCAYYTFSTVATQSDCFLFSDCKEFADRVDETYLSGQAVCHIRELDRIISEQTRIL